MCCHIMTSVWKTKNLGKNFSKVFVEVPSRVELLYTVLQTVT